MGQATANHTGGKGVHGCEVTGKEIGIQRHTIAIEKKQPTPCAALIEAVANGSSPTVEATFPILATGQFVYCTVGRENLLIGGTIITHNDFVLQAGYALSLLHKTCHKGCAVVVVCGNENGQIHMVLVYLANIAII